MLRPDAVVDDADDDVLTGQTGVVGTALAGEAEVLAAVAGGRLVEFVGKHDGDLRVGGERLCLVVGEQGREAVEGVGVGVDLVGRIAADVLEHLVLLGFEVLGEILRGLRVEVVLADRDDDRILVHHHDVAAGLALDDVFRPPVGFEHQLPGRCAGRPRRSDGRQRRQQHQ